MKEKETQSLLHTIPKYYFEMDHRYKHKTRNYNVSRRNRKRKSLLFGVGNDFWDRKDKKR